MRSGMHRLAAVLETLTTALDLGKGLKGQRAVEAFAVAAGEQISAHAWAEGVTGDTLVIATDSPVWSHQLHMLEPELIGKLKAVAGADCPVARLRFRSGSRRRVSGDTAAPAKRARRLSRADTAAVRAAAEEAGDEALARALAGALRAQVQPDEVAREAAPAPGGVTAGGARRQANPGQDPEDGPTAGR